MSGGFGEFEAKLAAALMPRVAIESFRRHYEAVVGGATGEISARDIAPPSGVPHLEELPDCRAEGIAALKRTLVLKLNGGLGTSMGMEGPKSLLPAKDGLSFLDIAARQVLHLRALHGCSLPLVLMDSFSTRRDSLAALASHPDLAAELAPDFLQHKVPKVDADSLAPVEWPRDPSLEWCPPGHGDLYAALVSSGMLGEMRRCGYRYAFVSNSDNLGAVPDLNILGWLARESIPFLMEVSERTPGDLKGGHLAARGDRLLLRELAQCPECERADFRDLGRWGMFNTNNLWIDLDALAALVERSPVIELPLIRNAKTVDPNDRSSPRVYQLESAMGAAIELFDGARALDVPRTRFLPVKGTADLLALWSDAYVLGEGSEVRPAPDRRPGPLEIELDPQYYELIRDLRRRVRDDAVPSLVGCRRLRVKGDVTFGREVVITGDVAIDAGGEPLVIRDGERLGG